ncbi:tail fiber protein [Perkinsela sp. CCAP 1560/4]|nr:tail fiber protein [Perkinsela sp. CCAP 1560/4]|eukprot:KNH03654.1 tail fiber protein [Perkinsela sp. CCAP 1560/4]
MVIKLLFLWYSSHKRYFFTDIARSWWNDYQEAHAEAQKSEAMNSWEEQTDDLVIRMHDDPMRIFVVVPSSLASKKGTFFPTFDTSNNSQTLRALQNDGQAHLIVVKPVMRKLKLTNYDRRIRKAFDKAQELSAHGIRFLPITIVTEEIGSNLFLNTVAKFPLCFVENLFDSVILYNPIFETVRNDRADEVPLNDDQRTIVNTFHARFGTIIDSDMISTLKKLKLPVLLLTNNIYEEIHGISFRTVGKDLIGNEASNLHRMHIDTERISALLSEGIEEVKEEFTIVVNTWNEIVVEKILQFVKIVEEGYQDTK